MSLSLLIAIFLGQLLVPDRPTVHTFGPASRINLAHTIAESRAAQIEENKHVRSVRPGL